MSKAGSSADSAPAAAAIAAAERGITDEAGATPARNEEAAAHPEGEECKERTAGRNADGWAAAEPEACATCWAAAEPGASGGRRYRAKGRSRPTLEAVVTLADKSLKGGRSLVRGPRVRRKAASRTLPARRQNPQVPSEPAGRSPNPAGPKPSRPRRGPPSEPRLWQCSAEPAESVRKRRTLAEPIA